MTDHRKGSFDYRTMDARIKKVLDARSVLDNTVQVAMPFVKATTTIQHELLGPGCKGFTLGLHAFSDDIKYEDIYSSQDGDMPLIGYTYDSGGNNKRVYAKDLADSVAQTVAQVFDRRAKMFSNTKGFVRIPPPGITQATVGRNKNGLLAMAQLEISVPSLIQLESLHKVLLVPGLGMVLEWGQQFADEGSKSFDDLEKPDISNYVFPWHDSDKLNRVLDNLARNQIGLPEILDDYVYPTNGQYMWMFGRVANFNVKSNSDGSYNCTVKIVGPSENSWAYSTKNTVVPAKDPSTTIHCASNPNSVFSYFTDTGTGINFKSLLDDTVNPNKKSPWKSHVIRFEQGNQKTGEPKENEQKPTISNIPFADSEDAYFMTWRFFVNVVLNDEDVGIKAIFKKASLTPAERDTIGILLPYMTADDPKSTSKSPGKTYLDDPMESFVGANSYLRSIDPSTMIIVNEKAAQLAEKNSQYDIPTSGQKLGSSNKLSDQFMPAGLFNESATGYTDITAPDRGFLSTGVWLNHKAVVESMASGDTILRGIVNLLERMNQASANYWQLSIDTAEPEKKAGTVRPYNYMVVDLNFRDSAENAVERFLDKVHTFNKYIRQDTETGKLVGSELIDCSIDLSLPKRLFSQIATLGLVQPSDLQAVSTAGKSKDELEQEAKQQSYAQGVNWSNVQSPKLSDPNDTLREMFAITVLTPKTGPSPDLTILPKKERDELAKLNAQCGKANAQLTAQTGGTSNRPVSMIVQEMLNDKSADETKKLKTDTDDWLKKNDGTCKKCAPCIKPPASSIDEVKKLIDKQPWSAAFVSYVMKTSGTPFPANAKHSNYAQSIKNGSTGWTANDPAKTAVKVGDIIVKNRNDSNLTYDSKNWAGMDGHGDIIIEASDASVIAVGGNVANTVTTTLYNLNAEKEVTDSEVYVILRPQSQYVAKIKEIATKELSTWSASGWTEDLPLSWNKLNEYYATVNLPLIPVNSIATATPPSSKPCDDAVYNQAGNGNVDAGKKVCGDCEKQQEISRQIAMKTQAKEEQAETKVRQFYGLRNVFRYVEVFPDYMVAQITTLADGNAANAFGASPGALSIAGDLTMPGINGIRVGELFWIDRIPAFYKAFGAFQVMSLEDTIDTSGWRTKINARFNFLGKKWKEAMAKKFSPQNNNVPDPKSTTTP